MSCSKKYSCWVLLLLLVAVIFPLAGQELNARVTVNSSKVKGGNRQLFTTLEESLRTFVNGRRWTDSHLGIEKPIQCVFTMVIDEVLPTGSFKGELYVQSHRSVEGNSYVTPMLNVRDGELEFDYSEHQPLQFDINFMQSNLTATFAYYAYLILGLDLDSRSLLAGTSFFRNMEVIADAAQSNGWNGWNRRNNRSRSVVAAAFNDGSLVDYREMWFDYHHHGLDVSVGNGELNWEQVIPSVQTLLALQKNRPTSVLIKLFGDTKLEEMVNLLSRADALRKKEGYELLMKLFPARNNELGRLR